VEEVGVMQELHGWRLPRSEAVWIALVFWHDVKQESLKYLS